MCLTWCHDPNIIDHDILAAFSWWRHHMEAFSALLVLCAREFTGHRWIPRTYGQWRGAWMFSLICALNKRLSKQWRGRWFETPSRPLWRHGNVGNYTACKVESLGPVDDRVLGRFLSLLLDLQITFIDSTHSIMGYVFFVGTIILVPSYPIKPLWCISTLAIP